MAGEETLRFLRSLWLGANEDEKTDIDDWRREKEEEMTSLVKPEDGEILSLIALRGEMTRNEIKAVFPSFLKRTEENLIVKGLLEEIDKERLTTHARFSISLHPLLGRALKENTRRPRPQDLVKTMLALCAHSQIKERDWRLKKAFQTDEFHQSMPIYTPYEIEKAAGIISESLTSLGLVRKEGKTMGISSANALPFLSLSPEAAWAYIMWPDIDESRRKNTFMFMSLFFHMGEVWPDELDSVLSRIAAASSWYDYDRERFFSLLLIEEKEGLLAPARDEEPASNCVISSDYTVTFSGSTPPLIALIAHLKTSDRMKIWMISKSSIKSAFALGYSTSEIIRYLESLSDLPVSSMLSRRIESWEKEYRSLIFERALVLRTDATRDRIIRNLPQLSPYIIESPREGIFLMDYETENEWREILYTFGFDMLAPTRGPEFKETVRPREFEDTDWTPCIPEERKVPYDPSRLKMLLGKITDEDRSMHRIRKMMTESGILFSEEMMNAPIMLEKADCWNYTEKLRLFQKAEKDRSWCMLAEDWKGASTVGTVESVSPFEDGDVLIMGRNVMKLSRIYRAFLIPVAFV